MNQSDQWETPNDLFQVLNDEFSFDFDLCASSKNHKVAAWSEDIYAFATGNKVKEYNSFWMNPPYSRGNIDFCMDYATKIAALDYCPFLVTLTRFDPSASWFQKYVDGVADEVRMLARRVKFVGAKDSYNFPCCVAIYNQPAFRCDWGLEDYQTKYLIWDWKEAAKFRLAG